MENFKQKVARHIYYPVLATLVCIMITISVVGLNVVYWTSDLPNDFSDAPVWLTDYSLTPLQLLYEISDPSTTDSGKALGAITVLVSGMVMGIFLQKTNSANNRAEQFIVITFIALAILQLVTLIWLPSADKANLNLINGKDVTTYLNSLLTRYSGIATAICGAALGFKAASEPKEQNT